MTLIPGKVVLLDGTVASAVTGPVGHVEPVREERRVRPRRRVKPRAGR